MVYLVGVKRMQILTNDLSCPVDVDRTLVTIGHPEGELTYMGRKIKVHKGNIQALLNHKARGHLVIVWSDGGWEWARDVVEWLGIENYVDLCMSKPKWYIDDKDANDWAMERYYIEGEYQL